MVDAYSLHDDDIVLLWNWIIIGPADGGVCLAGLDPSEEVERRLREALSRCETWAMEVSRCRQSPPRKIE